MVEPRDKHIATLKALLADAGAPLSTDEEEAIEWAIAELEKETD